MMKYLFLIINLALVSLTGSAQLVINDPYAQVRQVPEFHSVYVSGGVHLLVTAGKEQAVVVSDGVNESNAQIKTEVKDGVLYISGSPRGNLRSSRRGTLRAYISYTTLQKIEATGAVSVKFAERVEEDRLEVKLSGASKLSATVSVARLNIYMTGASKAVFEGNVQELGINCSGASDFKSYQLTAEKATVEASGASDVQLTVNHFLEVNATGASDVYYKGTPQTKISSSGASTVYQKK